MGRLAHNRTQVERPLASRSTAGRSAVCAVRADNDRASREHAVISWTPAEVWEVRDLGSRNGTYVDGQRLEPGQSVVISIGSTLAFGDASDRWTLIDDAAPGAVAFDLTSGEAVVAEGDMLVLPSEDDPRVSIYASITGRWLREEGDADAEPIGDEAIVQAGGRAYRVHLPAVVEGTPFVAEQPQLSGLALELAVSRDEETIELRLRHSAGTTTLGPREHGFLLLTLARQRIADRALPESEQGWIDRDELLRMLRIDKAALDLAVHRARRQFAAANIRGAPGLIEVRLGKRRIGVQKLSIVPL